MKITRQLTIEDRSDYFLSGMTNINDFDPSLLNIDKVSFRNDELTMYDIKYIQNSNILNTLYLAFNNLDGVFQRSGEKKYLIFSSTEKKNRIMLENYTEHLKFTISAGVILSDRVVTGLWRENRLSR